MNIVTFSEQHIPDASRLFITGFNRQRDMSSILPDQMASPPLVEKKLSALLDGGSISAISAGRLVGYLGAFMVDNFRRVKHRAAYVPIWAHAVIPGESRQIYNAMYREASRRWMLEGCQLHAVSLLTSDPEVIQTWFWNGFGLSVVDAIRSIQPLATSISSDFEIRKADFNDIPDLVVLEAEHWQHYAQAPVFMVPQEPDDAIAFKAFLGSESNSIWTAWSGGQLAGYMRFEDSSFGASVIVESKTTIAITGAFVRPAFRRKKAAVALLNAGLQHYAARGFLRCSVDFESFNIEAAAFWPKFFTPVSYSMFRVPEASG